MYNKQYNTTARDAEDLRGRFLFTLMKKGIKKMKKSDVMKKADVWF
jgi:hypothetical protein